ncbi:phage antirepressor [Liquorilactobacillus hordei]|uniref:phage antirepressor n=1 Tax=Liquorilactobacillus hordei TaxID=468911 RepID=UPI0039ED5C63
MEIKKYSNGLIDLPIRVYKDNTIEFDAEQAAIGLGLSQTKGGKVYTRWETVSKYLSQKVGKGDYITEPQFYKLAIKANNQVAERFQDWVTDEVLPSIRKHGAYLTNQKAYDITHNKSALADLLLQAGTQLKEAQATIAAMKPKALFADSVSLSNTSILVGDLAKLLKQNGINIGANRLFSWLRENGYLIRQKGTSYNMPTQKSMELGLFGIKETSITHSDGRVSISKTPKVTGKGQQYFIKKFLLIEA